MIWSSGQPVAHDSPEPAPLILNVERLRELACLLLPELGGNPEEGARVLAQRRAERDAELSAEAETAT